MSRAEHRLHYGRAHGRMRAALIKALQPGQRCWRCGRLVVRTQELDLDHADGLAGGLRAITHSWCNRGRRTQGDGKPVLIDCGDGDGSCAAPGTPHPGGKCRPVAERDLGAGSRARAW